MGANDKEAASYSVPAIGEVFGGVVDQVRKVYESELNRGAAAGLMNAVDIELNFKSAMLSQKGWVVFGKDTKEASMEIRLATRLIPTDPNT